MHKYVRKFSLLILFVVLMVPSHAQKRGYGPGYIISNEGETIEGWVKDRSSGAFMDLFTQIRFQADNSRFKRKYGPDEILGYGLNNQHFESMPIIEETGEPAASMPWNSLAPSRL